MVANPGRPCAPEKSPTEHVADQKGFLDDELQPALDAVGTGTGHVFFVDTAHFVYGTYLCCLWTILRAFVRAASGRQRFNVLGAWNAVTRQLLTVTNTTVVDTDTMCELLRTVAAENLVGPVTLVLDNARYQRNKVVQGLVAELSITLMYLPSYSPNLNPIERLWGFAKRQRIYGKYHPNFAAFRAAIEATLDVHFASP
jgi:transposase